ncbi:efflux RND transporter periplasmic adaptor subunit [Catenovulum sediminis]|uniref:Efflux RND transporter periplasmic adaptor subunit n=1 Tax=Catenovulum sediminis TaxID=1740262 RepID=A0ABV1RCY1_9ALTE|nr:efflux RND transporter periplasmic adaptor subunit [Catenovulum sediminis]
MKLVVLLFVTLIVGALYMQLGWSRNTTPNAYETYRVKSGDLIITHTVSGIFESKNKFIVRSGMTGKVEELLINEGDTVNKGQPIVKLDCRKHNLEIEDIKLSIERTNYSLNHFKKEEQALESLYQAGGKSKQEVSELTYKIAELDFDHKRLINELKQKHLMAEHCLVHSATNGVVSDVLVKEGQIVNSGEKFAQLIDTSDIKLVSYVNEFDVKSFEVGQKIKVSLGEYDKTSFDGQITYISELVVKHEGANAVEVEFSLDNMTQGIKVGQQAIVNVETNSYLNVKIVPQEFLKFTEQGIFINFLDGDEIAAKQITPVGGDYINVGVRDELIEGMQLIKH